MTPTALALVAVSATSLGLAIIGPSFGYASIGPAAAFWGFSAVVSGASVRLLQAAFPWRGAADAFIRGAVVSLAIVVASVGLMGSFGWLRPVPVACTQILLLVGIFLATRGQPAAPGRVTLSVPVLLLAVPAALLVVIVAYGLAHSPLTAYDSLSYHLFFPARWLQEHRLSIIPTPFSDEAQAYTPANGELYFLWLMLPLHGDLLARVGQVPFLALIGVSLYALARHAGARPAHAMWPAVFCCVSRPIVEQAVGADVDLICWGLFLASLYLGLRAIETDDRRDWILWGVGVGLYLGTKYVALVYAPVLFVPLLLRPGSAARPRAIARRLLWALPGLAVFALPWYIRNWVIAGSPIYPASLAISGLTIARGAFSRAAMLHSVFHTTELRLLPVMLAHAFGTTLILGWAPLAVLGVWRMARGARRASPVLLIALPVVMTALYWVGVPDNVDSRFMLPVAMLALVPLAFVFRPAADAGPVSWNVTVHTLFAALALWPLVGMDAEIPATLPWFMGGWLSLRGLVPLHQLPLVLGLVGAIALLLRVSAPRYRAFVLVAGMVCGSVALVIGVRTPCGPAGCEYLQTTSIFLRPTFQEAWTWVDAHVSNATFAYTGNNVPYPLTGPRLTNGVRYVNIDRHATWRLHDYDRAARLRRSVDQDALATSSGVLLPLDHTAGPADAVRPRFPRMRGDRDAWLRNLRSAGVTHVFISALSAYEIDFVRHNAAGFPIEDDWARGVPGMFRLVYENPQVRIYAVALGGHPS